MKTDFVIEDVVYISHDAKNVSLQMVSGETISENIAYYHIVSMITDKFVRVNKNTIVNLEYATRIVDKTIYMIDDNKFNIDNEYLKNATNVFYKMKLEKFLPN